MTRDSNEIFIIHSVLPPDNPAKIFILHIQLKHTGGEIRPHSEFKGVNTMKTYVINEHLKNKKTAVYPDDFPLLKNGSRFEAWADGEILHIQTTLNPHELMGAINNYLKSQN